MRGAEFFGCVLSGNVRSNEQEEAMDLVSLLITILVVGLIIWLVLYVLSIIPLPEPFGKVARIVVIVIGVIILIKILLGVSGVHVGI